VHNYNFEEENPKVNSIINKIHAILDGNRNEWCIATTDTILEFVADCLDDKDYKSLNALIEAIEWALFEHKSNIMAEKEIPDNRFLAMIINVIALTKRIENKLPNRKILLNKYKEFCKRFFPDEKENHYLQ